MTGQKLASAAGAIGRAGLIRSTPVRDTPLRSVPRDAAIPHLAAALDAATMRSVFQATIFADGPESPPGSAWQVRRCAIEWIKYRPGKNCTVAYRVGLHDRSTARDSEQLLCVRVFEDGRSLARFQTVREEDLVLPAAGRPVTHLPEMDMIVWSFPNDSKLPALPGLIGEEHLRSALLPAVVEAAAGAGWSIAAMAREVVQYVPEEMCMVRIQAHLERVRTGEKKAIVVYGKIVKDGRGADTFAIMQRLWDCDARKRGSLRLAQPLLYDGARHMLWQSGVPGEALLEDDLTGPRSRALLVHAATAVAALHTAGVPCARSLDMASAMSRLEEVRRMLPGIVPSCRETLESVVDRLLVEGEQLEVQPVAVLHGDLRLRHMIFDGDDISLIDVDALCQGSPWQDIGSLAAAMLFKGMLVGTPAALIEECLATFCAEYARRVPWPMSTAALRWHTSVALVNERALRPVTRLQQDNLERVVELIELASRVPCLEGAWC